MSLNFLPGRPNESLQAVCQATWQEHAIFTYCSGNNLIILSNKFTRLQTLYLESDCVAVDINKSNGFIAVAFGNVVHVYKPIHQVMKDPKWAICCQIYHDDSPVNSIHWGPFNNLIVGSNYLSLWTIRDEYGSYSPILLWNKKQPKPVYSCIMSEDAELVASVGKYDKNVKLWKRYSISGEQVLFHLMLLPHPSYVTKLKWRFSSSGYTENSPNGTLQQVLYTLCTDKKLRIWSCHDLDSRNTAQILGNIELDSNEKFCLVVDSWAINAYIMENKSQLPSALAQNGVPDLVVTSGDNGNCRVHALYELSTNSLSLLKHQIVARKKLPAPSFVKKPEFLNFAEVQLYDGQHNTISLILHDLSGIIRHLVIGLPDLFTDSKNEIGHLQNKFTGHNKSIQRLIRSSDGEALLTVSRFSENCVWCPQELENGATLWLKNVLTTEAPIKFAVIHEKGNLVICLLENFKLQAWECPNSTINVEQAKAIKRAEVQIECSSEKGDPVLMLNTPEPKHNHDRHFIAILYSDGTTVAYKVSLKNGFSKVYSEALDFPKEGILHISTIDPVHFTFFSNRPLVSLITKSGIAKTFKATVDSKTESIRWSNSYELSTGLQDCMMMRGSSTGKLCIIDSTGQAMSFWDLKRGVLEYSEQLPEKVQDIDWTSTRYGQSIVSVGFIGYALLYSQVRYDYTNNTPSYLPIEKIDITSHTAHDIGDSIWMKDGIFVVASGNQFYVKDKSIDPDDPFTHSSIGSRRILSNDIIHLNSVLNGPLPVYHPQFLIQCLYAQKLAVVRELLLRLFLQLRELELQAKPILHLKSDLGIEKYKFLLSSDKEYPHVRFPDPYSVYNNKVSALLHEQLTKTALPYMTRHQQITLMVVIECVNEIAKYETSVDYNGLRFLIGVKLFQSHRNVQKTLLMRDISWALHSDNKEILKSLINSHITSWEKAREYKISYWLMESDLIEKFEDIAKFELSKDDKRDPVRCAIFYLALRKKQILLSLWRMAVGHPEQQKMLKFLANDFDEDRWRKAALKNAFVLMSKHRYVDAATFFLLGDSLKDCVNVLYKQLGDPDLAIAVCRVYEGDNGPELCSLLRQSFLPIAIMQDDRWMVSFIYWKHKNQHLALKALVTSPLELVENQDMIEKTECVNKSFLVEDPALLLLYSHLRKRNINYFASSLEVNKEYECSLLLRVANILCRMGCDYVALSLVKNWEFSDVQGRTSTKKQGDLYNRYSTTIEPLVTQKVRPSLFDKFGPQNAVIKTTSSKKVPQQTKSLLDDYFSPNVRPSSGIEVRSRVASTGQESGKENLGNNVEDTRVTNRAPKKVAAVSAPRSLLDDFM